MSVPACRKCRVRPADTVLHAGSASSGPLCFTCADGIMVILAEEEDRAGGDGQAGLARWRADMGLA